MTASTQTYRRTAALRRAAVRATLAPSVHNTQPWHFLLTRDHLDIYLDPTRQLRVLDPTGRQMVISTGCALFNARVALDAAQLAVRVERFPDPTQPNLVARLVTTGERSSERDDAVGALDPLIELRHTNRRHFSDDGVPAEIVSRLEAAAASEDSHLFVVGSEEHRLAVATLSQQADAIENLDPAYRAELRAWTSDDPKRSDGVLAEAVPHVNGTAGDEVPIRDFDTRGSGWLPSQTRSSRRQCLLVLGTDGDDRDSWLRAGEALERILLEVTRHGFAASPLTQVVEVASARASLRRELVLRMNPHVLLRVGRAPTTPSSRRRRLVDMLDEKT